VRSISRHIAEVLHAGAHPALRSRIVPAANAFPRVFTGLVNLLAGSGLRQCEIGGRAGERNATPAMLGYGAVGSRCRSGSALKTFCKTSTAGCSAGETHHDRVAGKAAKRGSH
jgi:hypothetical protein